MRVIDLTEARRLQVGVNESAESTDTSVDTGSVGSGATLTPGNNTNEGLGRVDKRATRVTLARVLATGGKTSADHGGGDGGSSVVGLASGTGDDGDGDLAQVNGKAGATGGGGAPISVLDCSV